MELKRLKELQKYLLSKKNMSESEKEMLKELNYIFKDPHTFFESLSMSPDVCPVCGK